MAGTKNSAAHQIALTMPPIAATKQMTDQIPHNPAPIPSDRPNKCTAPDSRKGWSRFVRLGGGQFALIESDTQQHLSMLRILYATSSTALDAFHAADDPIDRDLVKDLETMVERTRLEIERLQA